MNIPEGWAIKSEELVSKAHGDLGYELDYSLCFSEKTDFAVEIPESIKKTAKAGYVFLNKLTGHRLQKGIDGLWRVISREGLNPSPMKKNNVMKSQAPSTQQEEEEEEIKQTPWPKEENSAPQEQEDTTNQSNNRYASILEERKRDRDIDFYIHQALRERSDRYQWIESNANDPALKDKVERAKRKADEDFKYAIEEILDKSDMDPDLFKEYMEKESKIFGPKNSIKNNARTLIERISFYKINDFRYDGNPPKDPEVSEEEEIDHFYGLLRRAIEKKCEITGQEPEKEFKRIKKKIEERIQRKVDKEISYIKNERQFHKNFASQGEGKGYTVRVPESPQDYKEYALVKDIAGHEMEFSIDEMEVGPGYPVISFTVDGSYDKVEGMSDKARLALAVSIKRAFDILLRTHKDSNSIFMVQAYNGDENGEYREKAYRDMGFGPPDWEDGYMRGKIVDGKMVPIEPDEVEEIKDDGSDEEFAEKNSNMIDAIYRILFLEGMK